MTFSLRKSHKSRWLGAPAGRPQVRDEEPDFNILLISALKSGASVIEPQWLQMLNSSMTDSYKDARQ